MGDAITTALDVVGLLAVAAGVGLGLAHTFHLGWWGLAAGGAVVLAGSALSSWRVSRGAVE